jgi:hypothetical protein
MSTESKILLPNDVRKLLNVDNKEIVELCKKTSVNPRKDSKGQIYFSIDEVKKLRNAKSSIISDMNDKKSALSVITEKYGFPARAIVTMEDVIQALYTEGDKKYITPQIKEQIDEYYKLYGAQK